MKKFYLKKEKFNESIENLKKDKIIKSALELKYIQIQVIYLIFQKIDSEDLFLVSSIISEKKVMPFSKFYCWRC